MAMTDEKSEAIEQAIQFAVKLIMSGRMEPQAIHVAIMRRGFEPDEVGPIIAAAIQRIDAYQKHVNKDSDDQFLKIGGVMIFFWIAIVSLAGYPDHGRGRGMLTMLLLIGIGTLGYGIYGRMTAKR
eukprot:Opistho-1_new@82255